MKKNKYRFFNKYYWLRKFAVSTFARTLFSEKKLRKIAFMSIFKSNYWRDYNTPINEESYSGKGSDLKSCNNVINNLKNFINSEKVLKILDLACGDFLWMKIVLDSTPQLKKYHGIEIVEEIVTKNQKTYSNEKIIFSNDDIIDNDLNENYDLIIARDFFIHIDNESIIKTIEKIKLNSPKFFAVTTTPFINQNKNLKSHGRYRPVNIEIEPFNLKNPYVKLEDGIKDGMQDYINIYKLK